MTHEIFVVDDQHPEDLAMLQALYSRSPASVITHLEKLKETGSGKFMDQFYVGYGHASIGDCGVTTCFIEQVSMLVAKAVQDNPLYSGQEASTRYLSYSQQAIVDPYAHPTSTAIQNRWMAIYNETLQRLLIGLQEKYPFDPVEYKNEKIWQNTLKARAFDIARSLLPIGTTTLLSWTTSLRQARDNLRRLKHHPLAEVRNVAQSIHSKLLERYPHSFRSDDMKTDDGTPANLYAAKFTEQNSFFSVDDAIKRFKLKATEMKQLISGELVVRRDAIDLQGLLFFERETLASRPSATPLPWRLEAYGCYNFLFLLDFGSFRDIQRHRNGVCRMPLIDGRFGLHPWYLIQMKTLLSASDFAALERNVAGQFEHILNLSKEGIETSPLYSQYLYPMGAQGLVHVAYSVPETVYVGELRSSKTVHPSLRPIAQKMLRVLENDLPGIALHGDVDEECWTAKRGEQTISVKAC